MSGVLFRISTRNIFLTYSQCPLPKEDVLTSLAQLLEDHQPHIRVGHELHQDGGHHLHVFIHLERKLYKRGDNASRYFDLDGAGTTYHPNIETRIRDLQATFDYVSKDNDFVDFGEPAEHIKPTKRKRDEVYARAIAADDKETFFEIIRDDDPFNYVIHHSQLEHYADKRYKPAIPAFDPYANNTFDINAYPDLVAMQNIVEVRAVGTFTPPAPTVVGELVPIAEISGLGYTNPLVTQTNFLGYYRTLS